jgi:protein O-GlcNAc transferase
VYRVQMLFVYGVRAVYTLRIVKMGKQLCPLNGLASGPAGNSSMTTRAVSWLGFLVSLVLLMPAVIGGKATDVTESISLARRLLDQQDYPYAINILQELIVSSPQNTEGLSLLGAAYLLDGQPDQALGYLLDAYVGSGSSNFDILANYISALHMSGQVDAVASVCTEILGYTFRPEAVNVFKNCATVLKLMNDHTQAMEFLLILMDAESDVTAHWENFVACLFNSNANDADIFSWIRRFTERFPGDTTAHITYAENLLGRKEYAQGKQVYIDALRINATDYKAKSGLASLYLHEGSLHEALPLYESLLPFGANDAAIRNNYGMLLNTKNRADEAKQWFLDCLRIDPNFSMAVENLVIMFVKDGIPHETAYYLRQLKSSPPLMTEFHIASLIPTVSSSWEEMLQARLMAIDNLRQLVDRWKSSSLKKEFLSDDHDPHGFYFTYHGLNDRPVLELAGSAYPLYIADIYNTANEVSLELDLLNCGSRTDVTQIISVSRKAKIGFISSFFYIAEPHGLLLDGIMKHLPRDYFEVHVLVVVNNSTIPLAPSVSEAADFIWEIPKKLAVAKAIVTALKLDILVFADTWGERQTHFLAQARLAYYQIAFWGNPMTSASPSVDYFLSADGMEFPYRTRLPAESEVYTEQVVLIEGQGIWYYRPESFAITLKRAGLSSENVDEFDDYTREQFGIPATAFLFLCPQSVFKIHPLFDQVFARILRGNPNAYVAVTNGRRKHWGNVYTKRLERALNGPQSAEWQRLRILPRVTSDQILSLMSIADVILHPFPFDGSRTSADALAIGTPFITLPSEHLRGRMGFMYYQTMNLPELVARNISEYVDIALHLSSDALYYAELKTKLRSRSDLIWEDMETSFSFATFFTSIMGFPSLSWERFLFEANRNVTEETVLRDRKRLNRQAFKEVWGNESYMLTNGVGELPYKIQHGELLPIFSDWKKSSLSSHFTNFAEEKSATIIDNALTQLGLPSVADGGGVVLMFALIEWENQTLSALDVVADQLLKEKVIQPKNFASFSFRSSIRQVQLRNRHIADVGAAATGDGTAWAVDVKLAPRVRVGSCCLGSLVSRLCSASNYLGAAVPA